MAASVAARVTLPVAAACPVRTARTVQKRFCPPPSLHLTESSRFTSQQAVASKIANGLDTKSVTIPEVEAEEEDHEFEEGDAAGLTTQQVHSLLTMLSSETEIAELEIKMGSFQLRVRRTLKDSASVVAAAAAAAAAAAPAPAVATSSVDLTPLPPSANALPSFDEDDADESLVYIDSPKVGVLRRGRYVKGKAVGKGVLVDVGDKVKKGQTLAFIEQLGTYVPVEAPQAGEIAGWLVEAGQPVEYKEPIIELAPFFGGHIIGDKKYA